MVKDQSIIDHFERFLGPIQESWQLMQDGEKCPFQVVRCTGRVENTSIFCTLGLGNHSFKETLDLTGQPVRHELLIAIPESFGTGTIPALVQQLGVISLERHKAFLRGEVIGGSHFVFSGLQFRGFYASTPSFVEGDDFDIYVRQDGQPVVMIWMIPVYEREIEFIRTQGWNRFEDLIIMKNLDPVELLRKEAVD